MLLDQFDLLNAFLEQDNVNIEIDITSSSKRGYTYKLINFKLDFRKKYIRLELKLDEYVFTKNITAINDIQMASLYDGFYYFIKYLYVDPLDEEKKVHKDTIGMYLTNVKYPKNIQRCNTKYYEREEKEYEKYRYSDSLKYYVEKAIYDYTVYYDGTILNKEYHGFGKDTPKYCLLFVKYHGKYELLRVDETGAYIICI